MTSDPKRLLEGGDADDGLERELLASVHDVRPPFDAKQQVWQGVATQLALGVAAASALPSSAAAGGSVAPPALAASAGAQAASTLVTAALASKTVWMLTAAGVIAAGGYVAARQFSSAPKAASGGRAMEVTAPLAAPPDVEVAPREPLRAPSAPSAQTLGRDSAREPAARRGEARRSDPLSAESASLTRARAALRRGDVAGAERMLKRMAVAFPSGVLAQEREVLAIEVLAARGDTHASRARARAFAEAYPNSPHTARLRPLLDAP